jgi:hypothetical protein
MSARYAPLPTHRSDPDSDGELEAAFDDSDDEDNLSSSESHPLNPSRHHPQSTTPRIAIPGAYDFERVDYDVPPPGSPTRAMVNDFGNSNGLIPSFNTDVDIARSNRLRESWFRRTAVAVLPSHYVERFGLSHHQPGLVGGGSSNDGVFANMMAKPERPLRVPQGDDSIYLAPEEVQKDAPPSYSAAQADAVPPYWETTIHLSSSDNPSAGEMIIDGMTTGSLFSFLWNMLVSVSFQFIGFLLTFLLHTTHSAKLGSRAGLGVTLIQYGFALRNRTDYVGDGMNDSWGGWRGGDSSNPTPSFETAAEADEYFSNHNNTMGGLPDDLKDGISMSDSTTEWASFLMMTVGWFLLLTSVLSFWRVKRWERSILNSSIREPDSAQAEGRNAAIVARLEGAFGLHGISNGSLLRQGFSFSREEPPLEPTPGLDNQVRLAEAHAESARLQDDLRSAGLLFGSDVEL